MRISLCGAGTFLILAVAMLFAVDAGAQSHGYVFVAPGVASGGGDSNGVIAGGVGGEGVFPGGFGLGAEIGGLKVRGDADSGFGLASLGGSFHIPRSSGALDPFIAAGYSALFQFDDATSFFHIGGGANWWFAPRFGLKLEFRDYIHGSGGTANIATFRFGFAFH